MSRPAKLLLAASASGLILFACRHAPSTTPNPEREIHVPDGCERNLAGRYRHARNGAFEYLGDDDGGTLTLSLQRTDAPPTDAGWASTRIVVTRTAQGFTGATRTIAFNALHEACAVSLPTAVTGCDDAGLTLRSAERIAIDLACQPSAVAPPMRDERLLRIQPDAGGASQPSDAGVTSGSSDAGGMSPSTDAGMTGGAAGAASRPPDAGATRRTPDAGS